MSTRANPGAGQPQARQFDPVQSVTRLAAGGVLRGAAGIADRLRRWEALAETAPPAAEGADGAQPGQRPDHALAACRHALIGLTVESERWLRDRAAAARRGSRPLRNPLPVAAWKARVARLVGTGRAEEEHAVALVQAAVDDLFGNSLPALVRRSAATAASLVAASPEVREMVRTQASGAAGEAVGRLREDSEQADAHVERRVRSLLRRAPREPEPPVPVEAGEVGPEDAKDAAVPPGGDLTERDASNDSG
jgi:hypothetical protein